MVINSSRQRALELTRNFCDAVSIGAGKPIDFYKMLWIVHWAIEQFGWEKTRDTLETLMVSTEFNPEQAPILLRDTLLKDRVAEDALGEWFVRAIKSG